MGVYSVHFYLFSGREICHCKTGRNSVVVMLPSCPEHFNTFCVEQVGEISHGQSMSKTGDYTSESLTELSCLSKKLAMVRAPPRVVGVKGARLSNLRSETPVKSADGLHTVYSAGTEWHKQRALHARLEKEWREGHGRAGRALSLFDTNPKRGEWGSSSRKKISSFNCRDRTPPTIPLEILMVPKLHISWCLVAK